MKARVPKTTLRKAANGRPGRRSQAERREATRRQLIEATIDVIYHGGFSAATVSEVARSAGVTTGALQHHFPSRDDLIVRVIDSIREGVEREMEKGFAADSSVRKRVEDIFNLYWKVFGGRHYIAAVQIQLGTMRNRHLFALVSRAIEKTEKALDQSWAKAFADLPLPAEWVKAVRYVMVAALRGMVIRKTHRMKRGLLQRERAVLLSMVTSALAVGSGRATADAAPVPLADQQLGL